MKQTLPLVSIIVLNYNGKKWLKACFDSVRKLNYPRNKYEVIMGDNASADDSVAFVKKNYPWIKIIRFDKNYGFCKSNNDCAKQAKGEYLAFLNNDTYVDKNWLIEMVKYAITHKDTICSPVMLDYFSKDKIIYTVIKMTSWGLSIVDNTDKKYPLRNLSPRTTFHPAGSGMLIKKNVFFLFTGFEKDYFAYGEDKSLGWKAWVYKYNVIIIPSSVHWHNGGGTLGSESRKYIYLMWRNHLANLVKYPETINMIKMLIGFTIVQSGGSSLLFLKRGKPNLILAMFQAYMDFVKRLPKTLKERRDIQSKRKVSDKALYKKGIILGFWGSVRGIKWFVGKKWIKDV